jgi:hypothetical protein
MLDKIHSNGRIVHIHEHFVFTVSGHEAVSQPTRVALRVVPSIAQKNAACGLRSLGPIDSNLRLRVGQRLLIRGDPVLCNPFDDHADLIAKADKP